ncbi:hypothetical protein [Streptomyces sp. NPDC059761]|uniref:hypothetical protein n=1 Tax=Streptomyces sp. NPDC059761 TaxID=3346937 RepID=UPI00365E554F
MNPELKAATVRVYARNAWSEFTNAAKIFTADGTTLVKTLDFQEYHIESFLLARAKYVIYAEALSLDESGQSAFDDEKVIDRVTDARRTRTRYLLSNRPSNSGIYAVTEKASENAARQFLSDTDFVDFK